MDRLDCVLTFSKMERYIKFTNSIRAFALVLLFVGCNTTKKKNAPSTSIDDIKSILKTENRLISLDGTVNFRDLGGIATKNGDTVVSGKLFRSDKLSELSDADHKLLKDLEITTFIDFRTQGEFDKEPDNLPESAVYFKYPIGDNSWAQQDFMTEIVKMNAAELEQMLVQLYTDIPVKYADSYKSFFQQLLVSEGNLVYHCTAGKDRTGIASAIILDILGVDWDVIKAEYELSTDYRSKANSKYVREFSKYGISEEKTRVMMGVKASYLDSIFSRIESEFGSKNLYYQKALGLGVKERKAMRDKFLK